MSSVVWASLSLQWIRGRGTKMLRLGCGKPGSWGSFWAILTLAGLAARAGEWAVGGVGVGDREEGQDLLALPAQARRGRCPASQASSLFLLGGGQPASDGRWGWATKQGPNHKTTLPLSFVSGSWLQAEADGTLSAFRSFRVTAWGGGAGKLTTHCSHLPFSLLHHTPMLCSPVSLHSSSPHRPQCACVRVCTCACEHVRACMCVCACERGAVGPHLLLSDALLASL